MDNKNDYCGKLKAIFSDGRKKHFQKGQSVLLPNDRKEVFYINKGYVKMYMIAKSGSCKLLAIHGPKDIIPVHWELENYTAELYYEALCDADLTYVPTQEIKKKVHADVGLLQAVHEFTLATFEAYSERIRNLELKSARDKVLYRLLFLARQFGRELDRGKVLVDPPINYQDISESINLTRETVNRELSTLMKEGSIIRKGQQFILKNVHEMAKTIEV